MPNSALSSSRCSFRCRIIFTRTRLVKSQRGHFTGFGYIIEVGSSCSNSSSNRFASSSSAKLPAVWSMLAAEIFSVGDCRVFLVELVRSIARRGTVPSDSYRLVRRFSLSERRTSTEADGLDWWARASPGVLLDLSAYRSVSESSTSTPSVMRDILIGRSPWYLPR